MRVEDLPEFNFSKHLDTPERVAAYLDAVLQERDIELLKEAIVDIYNSPGIDKISKHRKASKDHLQSLAAQSTQPFFEFADKVCEALGFRLGVQPITI